MTKDRFLSIFTKVGWPKSIPELFSFHYLGLDEINGRPYSERSISKMNLVSPLLPWVEVNEGNHGSMFNKEDYEINGHLYGKLKRGTYLIVLTSAETSTADYTDQVRFILRLVAPDITVSN